MTAHLALIRRHPIKTVGGEGLDSVTLQAAHRLPGDRSFAILTDKGERHAIASQTNGQPDRWLPKSCFLRGAACPDLQAVSGGWDGDKLTLTHPRQTPITIDPATQGDILIDWLRPLWPADAARPTRLVEGAAIWTDQKRPWISILSLDSLADLKAKTGLDLGTHRWRGNLWTKGWDAFYERDLIGQTIHIGQVELRVTEHIGRCTATNADTATGHVDLDMIDCLQRHYGHTDFGVFAEVVTGGHIRLQDQITL
ncbi:MOSC domain-containing protein [Paracoccus sp. JM45]|uniref:MOSC domain-containing protein n=1 Tax=Paracoccus sp. JM45 TaxID=2283626 RepID=UPI000E6B98F0|nr:MOSC domain-containing protein [Paracoccus sp. JM45]RJE78856.1 MOSC domain-containing protein [Paracoccus sp. JM45]